MTKKLKTLAKKIVLSSLMAVFFVGGMMPMLSAVSDNFSEISGVESAYAEQPTATAGTADVEKASKTVDKTVTDMKKKISDFASILISIFTPIIAILVKLIESLMSDDYIMGTNGGDGNSAIAQVLYELWIVFRDVMNYLFILILLFFAFKNVVSPLSDDDSYALKTVLPKMIMAIVIINMTWFGARVVFDVVDVSARIVFGLPQAILEGSNNNAYLKALDAKSPESQCKKGNAENGIPTMQGMCAVAYINLNSQETKVKVKDAGENSTSMSELKEKRSKQAAATCAAEGTESSACRSEQKAVAKIEEISKRKNLRGAIDYGPVTVYWEDFNYERFNQGTITPFFAFSLMQVQNLPRIAKSGLSKIENEGTGWSTLIINVLVALVIMLVLIVLFAMMVINLFFRVIILWINIIFSPFYGLMVFKDQLGIDEGGASDYIGLSAFIKHAFAPVIMGLPLVIGFIMIGVGKQHGLVEENGTIGIDTPLIDGVSNLHQLFYYVMAIAVLWVGGVKAIEATTSDMVQSTFIAPIQEMATTAAKFVVKSPMYINFIPIAGDLNGDAEGGTSLSLRNLSQLSNQLGRGRESDALANIGGGSRSGDNIQNYEANNSIYTTHKDDSDFKEFAKKIGEAVKAGNKNGITTAQQSHPNFAGAIDPSMPRGSLEALAKLGGVTVGAGAISTMANQLSPTASRDSNDANSGNTDTPRPQDITLNDITIFNNNKDRLKGSSTPIDDKKEYIAGIVDEAVDKYSASTDSEKKQVLDSLKPLLTRSVLKGQSNAETDAIQEYVKKLIAYKKSNLARNIDEAKWNSLWDEVAPAS